MPTNYLTQFATSGTANLPVEATWQNLTERATGFQTGLARSSYFNRLFAQGANAAYVIGQMVVDYASADADLDGATLYTNFKTALNSYVGGSFLLLAGGTLTGSLNIKRGNPYLNFVETDVERGVGGSSTYSGVYFKDKNEDVLGQIIGRCYVNHNEINFIAVSPDGSTNTTLRLIKYANTVTFDLDGKNVEIVSESSVADSGYIRFASGLQIVWEQLGSVSGGKTVTFAKAFSQTPVLAFSSTNSTYPYITALNKTTMTVTASNTGYVRYIAIGAWS